MNQSWDSSKVTERKPSIEPEKPWLPLPYFQALQYYGDQLTEFEKEEIKDYRDVYFLGIDINFKLKPEKMKRESVNFGFDDSEGDYRVVMKDHIGYWYQVIDHLGRGSFG